MKKVIFMLYATLFFSVILGAAETNTTAVFGQENLKEEDNKGNALYERSVTIKTTDYKVDQYWTKFSNAQDGKRNFDLVATSGTVQIMVEGSFLCEENGLNPQGCSGQKPFLVNQGILTNADVQVDANGDPLNTGEYRIPFDAAGNYDLANADAFYALDVFRDEAYYQDSNGSDATQDKPTTFFGTLINIITSLFSGFNQEPSFSNSPDIRNRYMANIAFGLQDEYMLEKNTNGELDRTLINGATELKATLLDYNEDLVGERAECSIFFLTLNSSSFTCNAVNFFGLSNFIPFINTTTELKATPDIVTEDTVTVLLSLAEKLDEADYLNATNTETDASGRTTLVDSVFNLTTSILDGFLRFLFGSTPPSATPVVSVDFNFTNPMPLTFIETDGTNVTDFLHFTLLGLESVYGTEVQSCTVKLGGFGAPTQTFTAGSTLIHDVDYSLSSSNPYDELNVTLMGTTSSWMGTKNDYRAHLLNQNMLDWCQRQESESSGLFSDLFSSSGGLLSGFMSLFLGGGGSSCPGTTYEEQVDCLLDAENYSVQNYEEKVHKGLILHLKEQDDFTPGQVGTTNTYKLINIKRGE